MKMAVKDADADGPHPTRLAKDKDPRNIVMGDFVFSCKKSDSITRIKLHSLKEVIQAL